MRRLPKFLIKLSLTVLFLAAHPLYAQITPAQVWQDWQNRAAAEEGVTLLGNVAQTGGQDLDVRNLVLRFEQPQFVLTLDLGQMALRQASEEVLLTLSDQDQLTLRLTPEEGAPPTTIEGVFQHPNFSQKISRKGGETQYLTTAPELDFDLLSINDMDVAALAGRLAFKARDLTATHLDNSHNNGAQSTFLSISDLAVAAKLTVFESQSHMNYLVNMTDVIGTTNQTQEQQDWQFNLSGAQSQFEGIDQGQSFQMKTSSDAGSMSLRSDGRNLWILGENGPQETTITLEGMPFAVATYRADRSNFNLNWPFTPAPTPQEFALGLGIQGITLSPELWELVDPKMSLPRDPMGVNIDFGGRVLVTSDLSDSVARDASLQSQALPFALRDIELRDLSIAALGATATASGSLSFDADPSAEIAVQTVPKEGVITADFYGVNAMFDALLAAQLIPQDGEMGLRMMMGLFLRPAAGDDHLTANVDFGNRGLAINGMQIK